MSVVDGVGSGVEARLKGEGARGAKLLYMNCSFCGWAIAGTYAGIWRYVGKPYFSSVEPSRLTVEARREWQLS